MSSALRMDSASLYAWLSHIQLHRVQHDLMYPDIPALAHMMRYSNTFEFDEDCYAEVKLLGSASGIPYEEFVKHDARPIPYAGTCDVNPIVVDDDVSLSPAET